MSTRYTRTIEVVRWTGDNAGEVADMLGQGPNVVRTTEDGIRVNGLPVFRFATEAEPARLHISTPRAQGWAFIHHGDGIVRSRDGGRDVVRSDELDEQWEPAVDVARLRRLLDERAAEIMRLSDEVDRLTGDTPT